MGPIDRTKLNPKGSSVALSHPFAATGARFAATLAERGTGRSLVSICTASGRVVHTIIER